MRFSENFEAAKNMAVEAAQTAAAKAKELAAVAKANISIYAEEDKVKKAEIELGKLYYRDYAVGEELDTAEYLPWCQKIDESKKAIAELKDFIASLGTESWQFLGNSLVVDWRIGRDMVERFADEVEFV